MAKASRLVSSLTRSARSSPFAPAAARRPDSGLLSTSATARCGVPAAAGAKALQPRAFCVAFARALVACYYCLSFLAMATWAECRHGVRSRRRLGSETWKAPNAKCYNFQTTLYKDTEAHSKWYIRKSRVIRLKPKPSTPA